MPIFTYKFNGKVFSSQDKALLISNIESYNQIRSLEPKHQTINYDLFNADKVIAFIEYMEKNSSKFEDLTAKPIKLNHPALLLSNSIGLTKSDIEKGFALSLSNFSDYKNPIRYAAFNVDKLTVQVDKATRTFQSLNTVIKEQEQKLPTLKDNPTLYKEMLEALSMNKYIRFLCAKTKYWNLKYLSMQQKDDLDLATKANQAFETMNKYIAPPRYSVLVEEE